MTRSAKHRFAAGSAGRIVLDSGALTQITSGDPAARSLWRELTGRGWLTVVPAVTLAETITGKARQDTGINLLIGKVGGALATGERLARLAGLLRFPALVPRPRVSGIDAIVAAVASETRPSVVMTTDPEDLGALLARVDGVRVIAI